MDSGARTLMPALDVARELQAVRTAEQTLRDRITKEREEFAGLPDSGLLTTWTKARAKATPAQLEWRRRHDAFIEEVGERGVKQSGLVAITAQRFTDAWKKFEALLTESVDAPMIRDEVLKLVKVRDEEWQCRAEAFLHAVVLSNEIDMATTVYFGVLQARADQLAKVVKGLEALTKAQIEAEQKALAARPQPVAPAPIGSAPVRLKDADGNDIVRIVRMETVEAPWREGVDVTLHPDAPVQKAESPQPSVIQLQIPEVLAAKLLPEEPAADEPEWEAWLESLEDGGTYCYDKKARTFALVASFEPPDAWSASEARRTIRM
jgi:hypothetical protein